MHIALSQQSCPFALLVTYFTTLVTYFQQPCLKNTVPTLFHGYLTKQFTVPLPKNKAFSLIFTDTDPYFT